MNIRYILIFLIIFILNPNFESQKKDKKREETTPYQEYLILLREYRKNCRSALKPFRYDGALTTHFSYKDYDYSKEVEIELSKIKYIAYHLMLMGLQAME